MQLRQIRPALLVFAFVVSAPAAASEADVELYRRHVEILAAPEMEGRGAGTDGIERAADYIAEQFDRIGLEPAGEDGYRQPFTVTTGAEMGEDNRLQVSALSEIQSLKPGKDYTPINFSASGEISGPLVFAGYGITSEDDGYDDYLGIEVEGKIVLVLRYEPPSFSEEGEGRRRYSRHANLIAKAINARNRGAKAVLLVNGDVPENGDSLIAFGSVSGPDNAGIVMAQVKNDIAAQWLRRSGQSLRRLQRDIDQTSQPSSFALGDSLRVSLTVDVEREQTDVSNIIGYLPGATDEYVVVGAHYDHLGYGDQSSLAPSKIGEVHHGADDNASGVAALLELARRAAAEEQRQRGLLLIAFAGEEIGLLGSAHWVEHPTRPLDDAIAMLNMDMVGRIDKGKLYVGGVGTAKSFEQLTEQAAEQTSFQIDYSRSGYSASDHTSFVSKKIPVLFFFSGLHSDYHKPSDTADKINAEAAMELVGMVEGLAADLQAGPRPEFQRSAPSHGHGAPTASGGGGGYGPYFGSIPDFGEIPEGVRFADITPGSPAAKGGVQAGDILTSFDGKPIQNLYDFTYALRDSKVGQTVEVKILRDSEERTMQVTLEQRR